MKLGLAENLAARPPGILVLGSGWVAQKIREDLSQIGFTAISIEDLPLSPEFKKLPGLRDPDAHHHFQEIFEVFRKQSDAMQTENQWVHPGVTVWAERSELEGWARRAGLVSLQCSGKNLQMFWSTLSLLKFAQKQSVPTLLLSDDLVTSVREIEHTVKNLFQNGQARFPFVLKNAYRTEGGVSHRVVRNLDDLKDWVPTWMEILEEQSGEAMLFLERYLESARCFVQPFVRMRNGSLHFFPKIDGSLMFEGKNWVEVCPAQNLDLTLSEKIETHSRKILDAADFVGIGSLVYLSDGRDVYLVEGLARLNLGFSLWEKIARTKALHWQVYALAPAVMGQPPVVQSQLSKETVGLNLKIYAEDTFLKIPSPGQIWELSSDQEWIQTHAEAALHWDVLSGEKLSYRSSGLLGQLTVVGPNWKQATLFAKEILGSLWISGGLQSNERFLIELLDHPWVQESIFYTGFVDEEFIPRTHPDLSWVETLSSLLSEYTSDLKPDESWIWMNQKLPTTSSRANWSHRVEFRVDARTGVKGYVGLPDGERVRVCIFPVTDERVIVRMGVWFFSCRRSQKGSGLKLYSLCGGRIHSVRYREGSLVEPKSIVLVIESLRQLVLHRLPIPVKITKLLVRPEDEVEVGQVLAELQRESHT